MQFNDHLYSVDADDRDGAQGYGYVEEGNEGWVMRGPRSGATLLWRLWSKAGTNFYTISDERRDGAIKKYGYRLEGHEGFVFPDERPGTGSLYRLWNEQTSDHFYTLSEASRQGRLMAQARIEHASRGFRWTTATVALFQANAITEFARRKEAGNQFANRELPLFQISSVFTLV